MTRIHPPRFIRAGGAISPSRNATPVAVASEPFVTATLDDTGSLLRTQLPEFITAIRSPALAVEDRRTYQPGPQEPDWMPWPRTVSGRPARITLAPQDVPAPAGPSVSGTYGTSSSSSSSTGLSSWGQFAFKHPQVTNVCLRRWARRQALFAVGFAGRGRPTRKRRRNYYSNVWC